MTAPKSRSAPPHRLDALEAALSALAATQPKVAVGGRVTEVTPAYCRIGGLSPFVRLGECVDLTGDGRTQLGEVVRIDAAGVTVKPFEATLRAGLGTTAWRRGFVTLNPHALWKGRTVNALGAPVDGCGPLQQGERPASTVREPPAPMR